MAKFRLLRAHYLPGDKWLPGDAENEYLGDERGTVVGDGTPHNVRWPTLEMEPLDEEAREMLERERERLEMDAGIMNPVENLPMNSYETMYVPGSNVRRRAPLPDGAPIARGKE
jgi:hypothetical protein